ncbi:MAG: HemK-related putative methylase [halophilic archaeon J07HX64]|nr:MAG: HemK-related putative methylase [halophilic archaeon J07HX64]
MSGAESGEDRHAEDEPTDDIGGESSEDRHADDEPTDGVGSEPGEDRHADDEPTDGVGSEPGEGRPRLADLRDVETVYQPAEDSRLLAETALEQAGVGPGDLVIDVGTGSGYVAARIRDETGARVVGLDINPDACRQARDTGVPVVRADLLEPVCGPVDLVVCNPPYLPTPPEQEWDDWMEAALSGGENGRAVVDRVLDTVGRVLAPDGRLLLLVSSLTDPDAVRETAAEAGLDTAVVAEESQPFERLVVLELTTGLRNQVEVGSVPSLNLTRSPTRNRRI